MVSNNQPNLMLTKNFRQLKAEVKRHIAAYEVMQGSYRGCLFSCLAEGKDDPQYIENTYGIPEVVSRIAESIFKGLPKSEESALFFKAFPDVVECDDKDLSRVPWQFLAAELRALPPVGDEIQAVIDPALASMKMLTENQKWKKENVIDAAKAAARAADWVAARAAAQSAAKVASAADWVADWPAAKVARAAARAAGAARRRQRDLLLKLIKEAPVVAVQGE